VGPVANAVSPATTPPSQHDAGNPNPRADPFQDQVAWYLKEEIAKKEDAGAPAVHIGVNPQILASTRRMKHWYGRYTLRSTPQRPMAVCATRFSLSFCLRSSSNARHSCRFLLFWHMPMSHSFSKPLTIIARTPRSAPSTMTYRASCMRTRNGGFAGDSRIAGAGLGFGRPFRCEPQLEQLVAREIE